MGQRLELQLLLEALLESENVYFQAPGVSGMKYPAIVYKLDDISTEFANNKPWNFTNGYVLTLIDPNPDSTIVDKLKVLPMCLFDRHFTTSGLNHFVFRLYF